ncbi:hypothetical protein C1H46_045138 [Malus baccata]|uniref:Vacuolar ATPase assembly integral membrane protein VMA21 homolog n=1 Tax=Malus baccata TaxID=106549 RepID=A0A540K525_MALBA|nr:hypothetical protein C1H46_045138 [Malus baccata]
MAGVIQKFVTASMFMWIIPVAILYAFNNNLLPGKATVSSAASSHFHNTASYLSFPFWFSEQGGYSFEAGVSDMSPYSLTLLSGFLAVISVNVVIAFYIYMAMKEPSDQHKPDPAFLAEAEASVSKLKGDTDGSSQSSKKEE